MRDPVVSNPGDLVVLCADTNTRAVVQAMLERPESLGIRKLDGVDVHHVATHDAGVRLRGPELLATQSARFSHALLVLDREGSGSTATDQALRHDLERRLTGTWGERAAAVVIDPELESWIVGMHAHFGSLLNQPTLDALAWWRGRGYWAQGATKPGDPKAAVEALLGAYGSGRSGARYRFLASRASLRPDRCVTPSFPYFVERLRAWFPRGDTT